MPHEPRYQGKSLSEWLEEYNRAGELSATERVSEAIRAMGDQCLPFLLKTLKHKDSGLKNKLYLLARRWHLDFIPPYRREPLKRPALMALKVLGPNAKPIVPNLLTMFENPATQRDGGMALYASGPVAIPALEKACESTNPPVRIQAAIFLALMPASYNGNARLLYTWQSSFPGADPQMYIGGPTSPDLTLNLAYQAKHHKDPNVRRATVEALVEKYQVSIPLRGRTVRALDHRGIVVRDLDFIAQSDADTNVVIAAETGLNIIDPTWSHDSNPK